MKHEYAPVCPKYTSLGTLKLEILRISTSARYADVLCVDQTRVILKDREPDEDYIHANWLKVPDGISYICTQVRAPFKLTDT